MTDDGTSGVPEENKITSAATELVVAAVNSSGWRVEPGDSVA
jgi:hypothetical protein